MDILYFIIWLFFIVATGISLLYWLLPPAALNAEQKQEYRITYGVLLTASLTGLLCLQLAA